MKGYRTSAAVLLVLLLAPIALEGQQTYSRTAFGPRILTNANAAPLTRTFFVTLPLTVRGTLRIVNGVGGARRFTRGRVLVHGQVVVSDRDFRRGRSEKIEKKVELRAGTSAVVVTLPGAPRAALSLEIEYPFIPVLGPETIENSARGIADTRLDTARLPRSLGGTLRIENGPRGARPFRWVEVFVNLKKVYWRDKFSPRRERVEIPVDFQAGGNEILVRTRGQAGAKLIATAFVHDDQAFVPRALIEWNPKSIDRTVGDGKSLATVKVTFTSAVKMTDVDLWVVPVLAPFVRLSPSHFDTVDANTSYRVRVRFLVPPHARPARYLGAIYVTMGRRTYLDALAVRVTLDFSNIKLAAATRVLTEASMNQLIAISPDKTTYTFAKATPELAALGPGHIIVSDVHAKVPQGLLRKVESVATTPAGFVVKTRSAALAAAFDDGGIDVAKTLTPDDIRLGLAMRPGVTLRPSCLTGNSFDIVFNNVVLFDADGNPRTTWDQIRANGSLSIAPRVEFAVKIHRMRIENIRFVGTVTETASLKISANAAFHASKTVNLWRQTFGPFVVFVGLVPVAIVPVLSVDVGLSGDVSVGITATTTQQAMYSAGLMYTQGSWTPIHSRENKFTGPRVEAAANAKFKAALSPNLSLLLYGTVGPYAQADAYLELLVDLLRTPWWQLYGGLGVGVGVKFEVLDWRLFNYFVPDVIGFRVLIAQARSNPPRRGSVAGIVRDAITRVPLSGVAVTVFLNTQPIASTSTGPDGKYAVQLTAGQGYRVHFAKAGYLPEEYYNVKVEPNVTTYLDPVLKIDQRHGGRGSVAGRIVDALTGFGVAGVRLDLRKGLNARTGPIAATTTTNAGGSYEVQDLPAGNYTGHATRSGYHETYFTVLCIGGQTTGNQNATMTPKLPPGETRIVLTWGATPRDLDSHLTGPLPGNQRFHMFFPYAESNLGSPWPDYVTLDRDDVTSYGPETTTVKKQLSGLYRFSVHDYTNRYSRNSTALSNSSAQVRVYRGTGLVAVFNVPPSRGGTLWTVFEMTGNTITPVNRMTYESNPGSIGLGGTEGVDPADDAEGKAHYLKK